MRQIVFILVLITIPSLLGAQATPNGPSKRAACVTLLSSFATEPSSIQPPKLPQDVQGVALEYFSSGCYGNCPAFSLRIEHDRAYWDGHAYVRKKGKAERKISPEVLNRLVKAWLAAKLYAMRDDYCSPTCPDGTMIIITDVQETSIVLKAPSYSKKVSECYLTIDGRPETPKPPQSYFELSRELTEFAKSQKWL